MQNRLLFLVFLFSFSWLDSTRAQWVSAPAPAGKDLERIVFPSAQTGYTATPGGYIYKTTNGGQNWTEILHPGQLSGIESYIFNEVHFVTEQLGFFVGFSFWAADYLILRTSDGGQTWQPYTYEFGFNVGECRQLDFPTASTGYVVGDFGLIFKTTNAGASWQIAGSTPGGADDQLVDVDFVDSQTGFALESHGRLYRTTNGGSSWQGFNTPLRDIQFFNAQQGYGSADDGLYATSNGGQTWTLVGQSIAGGPGRMRFVNTQTGYAFFGEGLHKTVDGGLHWFLQEVNLNVSAGVNIGINDLFCLDDQTGWLCGFKDQNGSPVSLVGKTSNGGGLGLRASASNSYVECPGGSVDVSADILGNPASVNWYLDGALSYTGPGTKTFANLTSGNHVVRVTAASGNNSVSTDVALYVESVPDFSSASTFTINTQPCGGAQASVYTYWDDPLDAKLLIFLNGNFVDTARFETDFNGYKYFKLPPVADTTTFQLMAAFRCGNEPVTLVTVKPQPLPLDDLDLSTPQEVLCDRTQPIAITLKKSQPGILYDFAMNGQYAAYMWGNGEDLTFYVQPNFNAAIFTAKASNNCFTYLKDSLLVQIEVPDARFGVNGVNLPIGSPVEVNFAGTGAASYAWDFGQNATPAVSTEKDPGVIQYNGAVNTQIRLITAGPLGCRDTVMKHIALYAPHNLSEYWALEMDASSQWAYTGNSISIDPDENVVFNGVVPWTTAQIPSRAGTGVPAEPGHGVYKYDRYGVLQWQIQHENKSLRSTDLVTDQDGNIIALYTIEGLQASDYMYFGSTDEKRRNVLRHWSPVIVKWDPNGKMLWLAEVKICNQAGWTAAALETDADNNLYILANSFNPGDCNYVTRFISADSSSMTQEVRHDFIAKLSPDGIFQWVRSFVDASGNPNLYPKEFAVDHQGNILVGGESGAMLAKYNQQGERLWVISPDPQSPDPYFTMWRLDVDEAGNTYINGHFRGTLRFGNITLFDPQGGGEWDHFILKVSPEGVVLWAKNAVCDGILQANSIVAKGDDVFVAVNFTNTYNYDGLTVATVNDISTFANLWMQLSAETGAVKRYALLNEPDTIDYAIYGSAGNSIALSPNALHLLGQNGFFAEWANTPLSGKNYLFVAKIPGLPGIIATRDLTQAASFQAEISPNPSHSAPALLLDLPEAQNLSLRLIDLQGRGRFLFENKAFSAGRAHLLLEDAPPGIYFMEITNAAGERRTLKWVRVD